ncbi:mitochondrial fission ELM1-domain-containing protein [Syncephalastrum racemosum]|uniref:Mitochondrial fission ELM1-domain-containing protein n=1 Tax=Syncephalastrum racemosum TaxID=13706 RepID=A0A1X2HSW7_SYNRA|nr:mitochondrial fission ELM1-domain-containing protein [Syncephalastrum racemosum]
MFGILHRRCYSTARRSVLVLSDGKLESTLSGMALGRRLGDMRLKTIVGSKTLQAMPTLLQKYAVDWSKTSSSSRLPWFLQDADQKEQTMPDRADYVVCTAADAIPTCLATTKLYKDMFSVYLGFPSLPFIYFDQVVLPRYEANTKLAHLGPYARQKNMIGTLAPLVAPSSLSESRRSSSCYTAVVVGGYTPYCRWYSEDAKLLVDNIRRMVHHDPVTLILTEHTTDAARSILNSIADEPGVTLWDIQQQQQQQEASTASQRAEMYESLIQGASRVVLTADLDYLTTHAIAQSKPVYIAFGDRCRAYLQHFQRWARDHRLTRKLRLSKTATKAQDVYSYLGTHPAWQDGQRLVEVQETLDYVVHELEALRGEKSTGKRRKDIL